MRNKHAESCKKGMYGIFRPGSKTQANFGYRSFTYSIYRYGLPECYQTMTYQPFTFAGVRPANFLNSLSYEKAN